MNKILVAVALVLGIAVGRWLTPVKIETKTVEVEKKVVDTDKKKETKVVEKVNPDGSKETVTTINETTERKSQKDTSLNSTTSKIYGGSKMTLSALGGLSLSGTPSMIYGASVTKPVLGPITAGAFFLTNSTIGVSLGLEF